MLKNYTITKRNNLIIATVILLVFNVFSSIQLLFPQFRRLESVESFIVYMFVLVANVIIVHILFFYFKLHKNKLLRVLCVMVFSFAILQSVLALVNVVQPYIMGVWFGSIYNLVIGMTSLAFYVTLVFTPKNKYPVYRNLWNYGAWNIILSVGLFLLNYLSFYGSIQIYNSLSLYSLINDLSPVILSIPLIFIIHFAMDLYTEIHNERDE